MLNVTIRQLNVFSAVARHLSFARAAEELHLSAPAVSMQIKQLEAQVRLPLFERSSSAVSLTLTGEYFLVHVRRMLGALKEGENLVNRLRKVQTGVLQLGMLTTAKYFVPYLLAEFLRDHPGVQPRLIEGNRLELAEALHNNELDIAIMGRPPKELDTVAEGFAPHPHGFVVAADHRLAQRQEVAVSDLAAESVLIREPGSGTRQTMEILFREWHIAPPVRLQLSNNDSVKQSVMAGLGLAFVSLHTVADELKSGRLVMLPLDTMPLMRQWHVVRLSQRILSPAAETFRHFILESGAEFLQHHYRSLVR